MMNIRTMINLTKNAVWSGVFAKFRKNIIVFFMIPVILFTVILAVVYKGKIRNEIKNNVDSAFMQSSMKIDDIFGMINDEYDKLSDNQFIQRILTNDIDDLNGIEAPYIGSNANASIEEASKSVPCLKSIGIYSELNDYLISNLKSGYIDDVSPDWYKYYRQNKRSEAVFSSNNSIYVCHRMMIEKNPVGLAVFEIDKDLLKNALRLDSYKIDIGIVLENIDGVSIFKYGSTDNFYKSNMIYKLRNETLKMTFTEGRKNIDEVNRTVIVYTLIYLAAGIFVVYLLSFLCSVYLYESLSNILAKVELVDGNCEGQSNVKSMNANVLANVSETENIEEKLAEGLNALQQAQLSALQMQINPHFVFNVLNYANSVIFEITKCNNDAMRIIVLLCDILDYAMDEPKYTATIEQEIEIAEKYVEIERMKTGIDFKTVFDVDKNLLQNSCLKLFLQPIIENAVMHGIKRARERDGKIVVRVHKNGEFVEFSVSDNGKGMTSEKLKEIEKLLDAPFEEYSRCIGMRNINQRIKLFYGREYGLKITSDENGTTVVIDIPIND